MNDYFNFELDADVVLDWISYLFFNKYYLTYLIFVAVVSEWQISKIAKFVPKNDQDRKRDEKFKAFKKVDINIQDHLWARILFHLTMTTMLPRLIYGWGTAMWCGIMMNIIQMFGGQPGNYSPWQTRAAEWVTYLTGRIVLTSFNVWSVTKVYPKVCYKKYLGPDWVPKYTGAGSRIGNHQSWMDTLVVMTEQVASFVSKASVKNIPFVGVTARLSGSLFFDRTSTTDRKCLLPLIDERQKQAEAGIFPPLVIFPEGGTTNGTCLIKFAKGAFAGLNAVQPTGITYKSALVSVGNAALPFAGHFLQVMGSPWTTCEMRIYPVFKPNEYFWTHHQKNGEEQWETYARVMREFLAEQLDLEMEEYSYNDKTQYRKLVFGEEVPTD